MAPRCGAGHCGCGGRAPPPPSGAVTGPTRAGAPGPRLPPSAAGTGLLGLEVPGAHGSARSRPAAPRPRRPGIASLSMGFVSRAVSSAAAPRGCSRPSPSPPAPALSLCCFLGPRPRGSAAALALRGCGFRARAPRGSPAWAPPRGPSTPRASLGGAGGAWVPRLRCLRGHLAVPAVPAPPPPPRAACCGRRAPGPALGGRPCPAPMAPPFVVPSYRRPRPLARPAPAPRPRSGVDLRAAEPLSRLSRYFRNRPGRLLPRRTQIMGSRAAGSSRLGPLTHLVKIAPGTPRPASPRPDRLSGGTAAWEAQPASRSEAEIRVPGQGGPGRSPARGTGDHPR